MSGLIRARSDTGADKAALGGAPGRAADRGVREAGPGLAGPSRRSSRSPPERRSTQPRSCAKMDWPWGAARGGMRGPAAPPLLHRAPHPLAPPLPLPGGGAAGDWRLWGSTQPNPLTHPRPPPENVAPAALPDVFRPPPSWQQSPRQAQRVHRDSSRAPRSPAPRSPAPPIDLTGTSDNEDENVIFEREELAPRGEEKVHKARRAAAAASAEAFTAAEALL